MTNQEGDEPMTDKTLSQLAVAAAQRAGRITQSLRDSAWRPTRQNLEGARNDLKALADAALGRHIDVAPAGVMPTAPGYYWAKWRLPEDGTRHGDELTPSDSWEVVEVVINGGDPKGPEYLMVSIPGVEKSQSPENFYWARPIACIPLPGRG